MNADWQDIAALGLVTIAGAYLARQLYRFARRRSAGCGSCAACPADDNPNEKSMVSVESLVETAGGKENRP